MPFPLLKTLLLWLAMAVAAILNGTIRQFITQPLLGVWPAHVLHTLLFCAVLLAAIFWFVGRFGPYGVGPLLAMGLFLLLLTVAFEFGFGHYVAGHAWSALLADYNLLQGRVWVLVLLTELFGPLAASRLAN